MKKKTLFITTKNLDYLRNTQEINLLKSKEREVDIIGSFSNCLPKRLFAVYKRLLFCRVKDYNEIL